MILSHDSLYDIKILCTESEKEKYSTGKGPRLHCSHIGGEKVGRVGHLSLGAAVRPTTHHCSQPTPHNRWQPFHQRSGFLSPQTLVWCGRVWRLVAGASFRQGPQREAFERSLGSLLPGSQAAPTPHHAHHRGWQEMTPLSPVLKPAYS